MEQMPERGPQVPEADYQGDDMPSATPEQQEEYNTFVSFGMRALASEGFTEVAVKKLQAADDKRIAVAELLAKVVFKIYADAQKDGVDLDPAVVLYGSWELLERVIDIHLAAGGKPLSEDDREGAFYYAADLFRADLAKAGLIDPAVIEQDMAALQQMESDGSLAQVAEEIGRGREQPQEQPRGLGVM